MARDCKGNKSGSKRFSNLRLRDRRFWRRKSTSTDSALGAAEAVAGSVACPEAGVQKGGTMDKRSGDSDMGFEVRFRAFLAQG